MQYFLGKVFHIVSAVDVAGGYGREQEEEEKRSGCRCPFI